MKRGAYADVLARFWRICEGAVYYRLKERHDLSCRDIWRTNAANGPLKGKASADDLSPVMRRLADAKKIDLQKRNDKVSAYRIHAGGKPRIELQSPDFEFEEHINFRRGMRLLEEFGDHKFIELRSNPRYKYENNGVKCNKIDELAKKRHNTIVAHGMSPVDRKDAEKSIEMAKDFLDALVPSSAEKRKLYPFTLEEIRKAVKELLHV
jgi:hypothetical protein